VKGKGNAATVKGESDYEATIIEEGLEEKGRC